MGEKKKKGTYFVGILEAAASQAKSIRQRDSEKWKSSSIHDLHLDCRASGSKRKKGSEYNKSGNQTSPNRIGSVTVWRYGNGKDTSWTPFHPLFARKR